MRECTVHSHPPASRPKRRVLPPLVAGLLLCAAFAGAADATAAFADDTAGISGAPAGEAGRDGRTRFSYEVSPGQTLADNYSVQNTGSTAQVMRVFATDAFNTDDGSYGLLDTDAAAVDAGTWVTFANGASFVDVPLGAGESATVPFTLAAPADAAPGDHAAGIVVSVTSPQGQILVDRRVATRLYVRVPGDLQPGLTVSSISAGYDPTLNPLDGTTTVTFTVTNNGNVALGANMVVGANTYLGIAAAPIVREQLSELLPRSTRVVTVDVPGVAQLGYLNPYVSLAPVAAADAANPGPLTTVGRDTVTVAVPWWLVVLLVVAAVVVPVVRIRRRIDARRAEEWVAHMEAEARTAIERESAADRPALEPTTGGSR